MLAAGDSARQVRGTRCPPAAHTSRPRRPSAADVDVAELELRRSSKALATAVLGSFGPELVRRGSSPDAGWMTQSRSSVCRRLKRARGRHGAVPHPPRGRGRPARLVRSATSRDLGFEVGPSVDGLTVHVQRPRPVADHRCRPRRAAAALVHGHGSAGSGRLGRHRTRALSALPLLWPRPRPSSRPWAQRSSP